MRKLLFLLILTIPPLLASAETVEIDGVYYNLNAEAKTAEVTKNPNEYSGIPSVAVQSSYENMFVGNTSGNEIQVLETSEDGSQTNYYLKGDGSFVSVKGYVNIKNNKCYLALPTSMVAVSSTRSAEDSFIFEEPEVIKLPIDFMSIGSEGDGTTGVKEVKSGEVKGDEWYTLQGQRVAKPGKGLYIRNGKKVVIK